MIESAFMIEANAITMHYHDGSGLVEVFQKLNFKAEQGSTTAIMGASGSGKSTLLHVLAGLEHPTNGSVIIDGKSIYTLNDGDRAYFRNQRMGFVYQFHHLLPEMTALENTAIPLLLAGYSVQKASQEAEVMLDRVGLASRLAHRPGQLSGGERQRVAIARALVASPACIFADEPTGNLDSDTAESVFSLLLSIQKEQKTTLVFVTHDTRLAALAQHQLVLHRGVLVDQMS